jgi:hypothetical protein
MSYSQKTDVYAYGVMLYELITDGATPFGDGVALVKVAAEVSKGALRLELDVAMGPVLVPMMDICTAYSPQDRPTFEKVCMLLEIDLESLSADRRGENYNTIDFRTTSFDGDKDGRPRSSSCLPQW